MSLLSLAIGAGIAIAIAGIVALIFATFSVAVPENKTAVILHFGKVSQVREKPGLLWLAARRMPWCEIKMISRARDYRAYDDIHSNDEAGTYVRVDAWVELRVVDPVKSLFAVGNLNDALRSVTYDAVAGALGARTFAEIVQNDAAIAASISSVIAKAAAPWGVEIEAFWLKNIHVRTELEDQLTQAIAARLELAKARLEEEGRLRIEDLEAQTQLDVAEKLAHAKGQYPEKVGAAYQKLGNHPEVLDAYQTLLRLGTYDASRTVVFDGFASNDVRAMDAAMMEVVPQPVSRG